MCNACGFLCCPIDCHWACGCEDCFCPACWAEYWQDDEQVAEAEEESAK